LAAVQVKQGNTWLQPPKSLECKADLLRRTEEHEDLALQVGLNKSVQRVELLTEWRDNVVLL
jgi:hypothetical protein